MDPQKTVNNERQSKRTSRSVFSTCINNSNEKNNLTSVSNNFLIKSERILLADSLSTEARVSKLKNCCTQTSKTIIELARLEAGDISPDSLSGSPKHKIDLPTSSVGNSIPIYTSQSTYRIGGASDTVTFDTSLSFSRKDSLRTYLEGSARSEYSDYSTGRTNSPICPDGLLTEAFLEKKKNRPEVVNSNTTNVSTNRSKFLQQTSPLRKLIESTEDSIAYNDVPTSNDRCFNNSLSRFKVKLVKNASAVEDKTKPVKYYCQNIFPTNADKPTGTGKKMSPKSPPLIRRRCNSFMDPTISSRNKNHAYEVEGAKCLISPIRRGRSTSPKKVGKIRSPRGKVPYIDQSSTNAATPSSITPGRSLTVEAPSTKSTLYDDTLLKINLDFQNDALEYGSSANTSAFRTDSLIGAALSKIRDRDWNVSLKGFAELIEIAKEIDVEYLLPHMTVVNQKLIDLLRSPRSHVCRTACQAAGHLFEFVRDTRRPEFDDIVELLLFKTADANKFIRQDANLSLDCMVTHIAAFHAVRALCAKGPVHKNPLVRTATVRLLICVAVISGPESLFNPNYSEVTRKKLVQNMAKFISDKNYETRKYGERLYKVLCRDTRYDVYAKKYLEPEALSHMRKQLRLLHQRR